MSPQGLCHILMGNLPCALMDSAVPIPTGTPPCPYSHVPTQSQPHRDRLTLLQGPRCAPHILLSRSQGDPATSLQEPCQVPRLSNPHGDSHTSPHRLCNVPTGTPPRPHRAPAMPHTYSWHVPTGTPLLPTYALVPSPDGGYRPCHNPRGTLSCPQTVTPPQGPALSPHGLCHISVHTGTPPHPHTDCVVSPQ